MFGSTCEHVGVRKSEKIGHTVLDHGHGRKREQDRSWPTGLKAGPGLNVLNGKLSRKEVLSRTRHKTTPKPAAHNSLAVAFDVPCQPETRREIIPVAIRRDVGTPVTQLAPGLSGD
jgi:hypothetical protein